MNDVSKGAKLAQKAFQGVAGLVSAGISVFMGGSASDLAFSGAGLGITAVDTGKVISPANESVALTTLNVATKAGEEGAGWVPIVGNVASLFATLNDANEWNDSYNECMAGK